MTILVFLIVLTVLVLIHELGHYLVAKFFKIKVEEFGIGFPPRVWGKKIGETVYSINWLPIGGFVKLYGEDPAGGGQLKIKNQILNIKNSSRAFFTRPWWQKALVIVAGVLMNFFLAVFILSFLFAAVGSLTSENKVLITQTIKGSPAQAAGLKGGEVIESLNDQKITSTQQLISETKKYLGERISLKVRSGGQLKEINITPRKDYPKNQGPLGIVISQKTEFKKYPLYQAPVEGFKEAIKRSELIIVGTTGVIAQLVTTGSVPQGAVAGPVAIAQVTGFFCSDVFVCLNFVSFLSLNLAILNILPIPALDGGRLFFVIIEGILRRKVHPKFESYTHAIGIAIILSLLLLITIYDVARVLSGQSIIPK